MKGKVRAWWLVLVALALVSASCGGSGATMPPPPPSPSGPAPATDEQEFTIAVIPDSQYYVRGVRGATMEMFLAQTRWIADKRQSHRIAAVIGLGDIVECADVSLEWEKGKSAYAILEEAGLPYVPTIGNHDYDGNCGLMDVGRSAQNFNLHFGPQSLTHHGWYGGNFAGSNENFYITFSAAGRQFVVLALEFYPRDPAIAWAQEVLDRFSESEVILVTHSCVTNRNGLVSRDGERGPLHYGLQDGNSGQQLFNKLVRKNPNIRMVLSGHLPGAGRAFPTNDTGKRVPHMLSNYQDDENGGNGYLRLLRFRPSQGVVEVSTYSPFLDRHRTDRRNRFRFQYR